MPRHFAVQIRDPLKTREHSKEPVLHPLQCCELVQPGMAEGVRSELAYPWRGLGQHPGSEIRQNPLPELTPGSDSRLVGYSLRQTYAIYEQ